MKIIIALIILLSANSYAESLYSSQLFKSWPSFALKHEFEPEEKDFISFKETDFQTLKHQAETSNDPMHPTTSMRVFDDSLTLKDSKIKWYGFMSATAGSHVSGFSQGIGMSTMLIKDELYMDAEVAHLRYNFDDRYYGRYFDGDKYRLSTMLHWYPTDDFSLHLGFSGLVDK